jgi:DUF4097 and DUF4098 domain-containing protein YvlB
MKTARYLPLLLALCIGQALADTPINLRHEATPTTHVAIGNIKGAVSVTAWDRNEVQVTGRLGDGAQPLAITGSNGNLEIKVRPQAAGRWFNWSGDNNMSASTLELRVPRGASLDVDVVSASLGIDGLQGGKIAANSVSGKVRINARASALDIDSVSGSIELAGHSDQAHLQTVSGDILAPTLGSAADLQTVSGRIQANGGPWRKFNLSTVSGDVQLRGALAADGSIDIDSMSGDVQVVMPATVSAAIEASSFSGDLRSDFGAVTRHEHGPGSELKTSVGDGHGKIHVETFSGDLRLRKGE